MQFDNAPVSERLAHVTRSEAVRGIPGSHEAGRGASEAGGRRLPILNRDLRLRSQIVLRL